MGGVFSTVADLARWVGGFAAAFPPRDGDGRPAHPLGRASRREMQLAAGGHRHPAGRVVPRRVTFSYGFGLFVEEDPVFGTVVQHSGGYPGYGSQMRWHPATGIGAIVLGNGTYAHAGQLAAETAGRAARRRAGAGRGRAGHRRGSRSGARRRRAVAADPDRTRRGGPAAAALGRRAWPRRLFTPNVAWDQPLADRRAAIGRIRDRIGDFRPDPDRPAGVRLARALPVVAARRAGHRAGRDRAGPAVVSRWSSRCGWPCRRRRARCCCGCSTR